MANNKPKETTEEKPKEAPKTTVKLDPITCLQCEGEKVFAGATCTVCKGSGKVKVT